MRIFFLLFILLPVIFPALPYAKPPEINKAAHEVLPYSSVNDYSEKLSISEENALSKKIDDFRKQTSIVIAVLILPTIKPHFHTHDDFAVKTFNRWGIGEKFKDNGVLITIATVDRVARITVGYGMECVFTNKVCEEILFGKLIPNLKKDDYYQALSECLEEIFLVARRNIPILEKTWDQRLRKSR